MQRFFPLIILLAACGPDDETKTDATTPTTTATDTASPNDTTGSQTSQLTGVTTPASPDPEPTANAGCAGATNLTYAPTEGLAYPWQGLDLGAKDYTCNGCKSGDPNLQGSWRVHGFANPDGTGDMDYDHPDALTDYGETLKIDGNTFEVHIRDATQPEGERDSIYRGWYFCSQKPEQNNEHLYWVVTEVDDGEQTVGTVIETDVVLTGGANNINMYWYEAPGAPQSLNLQYCRVGTTNPDNNAQICNAPF